jgi:hypothetical protein
VGREGLFESVRGWERDTEKGGGYRERGGREMVYEGERERRDSGREGGRRGVERVCESVRRGERKKNRRSKKEVF